jgi:hypothetical protein
MMLYTKGIMRTKIFTSCTRCNGSTDHKKKNMKKNPVYPAHAQRIQENDKKDSGILSLE